MPNKIFLSDNLKRLAKEKGVTPVSLANRVNSNKSTIHNYFTGSLPQTVITLKKIADFFGVELEELIFRPITKLPSKRKDFRVEGRYELIIKKKE